MQIEKKYNQARSEPSAKDQAELVQQKIIASNRRRVSIATSFAEVVANSLEAFHLKVLSNLKRIELEVKYKKAQQELIDNSDGSREAEADYTRGIHCDLRDSQGDLQRSESRSSPIT